MIDLIPSNTSFSGHYLCKLEAHEIVAMLKKGEVSSKELLDASRSRIESVEPSVNAMPTVCWERAEAHAKVLDNSRIDNRGWLRGLPVGIKDLNAVQGVRSTWGTKGLADFIPEVRIRWLSKLKCMVGWL